MEYKVPEEEDLRNHREWAEKNYEPFKPILGLWHPVVQLECVRMNILATKNGKEIMEVLWGEQ